MLRPARRRQRTHDPLVAIIALRLVRRAQRHGEAVVAVPNPRRVVPQSVGQAVVPPIAAVLEIEPTVVATTASGLHSVLCDK